MNKTQLSPFKYLDYFVRDDHERFAGRDRELRELVARVTTQRTSVLYGRSGLGKTSLLLAGLLPELEGQGYRTVYVRTLLAPLAELERSVAAVAEAEAAKSAKDLSDSVAPADSEVPADSEAPAVVGDTGKVTLGERIHRLGREQPVLLVFDQFEEFFIRFAPGSSERTRFIAAISGLVRDTRLNLRVLVSLREDYLAQLGDFRQEVPDLFRSEYRLLPLTAFGARQAITQPLEEAGIPYDPRLINQLVDLLSEEGFDSVLLQIVCTEVFRAAQSAGRDRLTLEVADFAQLRVGAEDADEAEDDSEHGKLLNEVLRRNLDQAIVELPTGLHLVARAVLDALVTLENTKQAATREDFERSELIASEEELDQVLGFLDDRRLVRKERRDGKDWFELKHDRLVDTVLRWIEGDPDFFDFREARNQFLNLRRHRDRWRQKPELLLSRGAIEDIIGKGEFRHRLSLDPRQLVMTVRSCLYRLDEGLVVEHLKHWAGQLEEKKGAKALLDLVATSLDSPYPKLQLGAILAIEPLELDDPSLAHRLAELSLGELTPEVQRAAGKALALIADPAVLDRVREALQDPDRERKGRARELLADLEGHGLRVEQTSPLDRWRAQRLHVRRQMEVYRDFIDERRTEGAKTGFVSSLIWSVTLGGVFAVGLVWGWGPGFWSWSEDSQGWGAMVFQLIGLSLLLAPVGAFLGSAVAKRSARVTVLSGKESWGWVVSSAPSVYIAVFLLATLQIGFFVERSKSALSGWAQPMEAVLALTLLVTLVHALLIGCIQRTIPSSRGRWLWLMAASFAFPMVIFVVVRESLHLVWDGMLWEVLDALFVTPSDWVRGFDWRGIPQFETHIFTIVFHSGSAFGSWLVLVVAAVLLRSQGHSPAPAGIVKEQEAVGPRWSFGIVGLAFLLVLAWWIWQYGPRAVPIRVPLIQSSIDLEVPARGSVQHQIELDFGRGPFNTRYFKVQPTGAQPLLLEVADGSDGRIWIDGVETPEAQITEQATVAVTNIPRESRTALLRVTLTRPEILEGDTGEAEWKTQHGSYGWWKWQHLKEVQVYFDTEGSNYDTILSVYRDGELVDRNDDILEEELDDYELEQPRTSRVGFKTDPGATYEIVIEPFDEPLSRDWVSKLRWQVGEPLPLLDRADLSDRPDGEIEHPQPPAPENDWVGAALVLEGDRGQLSASSLGATTDGGDLLTAESSVWWTWYASADAVVTFDTLGSDFDTFLWIFRRQGAGWKLVARNDDAGGERNTSRVRLVVEAETTYYIGVGGYQGDTGQIELSWNTEDLSGPDEFAKPALLDEINFASNHDATSELDEPPHAGRAADRTVWWAWSMETEESVNPVVCLEARAKGFSPVVAVYVGEDLARLRTVASYDAAGADQALTCWRTETDVTYKVVVGSGDGRAGVVELSWFSL